MGRCSCYTLALSILNEEYLSLGGFDSEYVQVAWITAYCQPIALPTEGYRVDSRELVASSHLLDHYTSFCVKYPHLVSLLRCCC